MSETVISSGKRVCPGNSSVDNGCFYKEKHARNSESLPDIARENSSEELQNTLDIQEPLLEVFSLHEAFRRDFQILRETVNQLTVSATDQELDKLRNRIEFTRDLLLGHCCSEDRIIIPALSKKLGGENGDSGTNLATSVVNEQHNSIKVWFDSALGTLGEILETPFSVEHRPLAQDEQLQEGNFPNYTKSVPVSPRKTDASPNLWSFESPRAPLLEKLRIDTYSLTESAEKHLLLEEQGLTPLFHTLFTVAEQGALLASVIVETSRKTLTTLLPSVLRVLNRERRIRFVSALERYMTREQFEMIAEPLIHELSFEQQEELFQFVPSLRAAAERTIDPFIEITHLHKAIRKELESLASYAAEMDPCDNLQIKSLYSCIAFLQRVYSFHSLGEDEVIVSELKSVLEAHGLEEISNEHCNESLLFGNLLKHIKRVASVHERQTTERLECMSKLAVALQEISTRLIKHMEEEESRLLPLVRCHFSLKDQDKLIRRVMAKIPQDFLPEILPWLMNALDADEREKLLGNILRSSSSEFFRNVSSCLFEASSKGKMDPALWDDLCLRIPELQQSEMSEEEDNGPVEEILRIHKAIRCELQKLYLAVTNLAIDVAPNPNTISSIAERFFLLGNMVNDHSQAEDNIVLPALEKRLPGISKKYESEHCDERQLFSSVLSVLQSLQCAGNEEECQTLLKQLRSRVRALHEELNCHLDMEEKNLWPVLTKYFTREEQVAIVGELFGRMPSERLQEMLPWLVRTLTSAEQNNMLKHILQVTRSTMFERWLSSWFPLCSSNTSQMEFRDENEMSQNEISFVDNQNSKPAAIDPKEEILSGNASTENTQASEKNAYDVVRIQSKADLEQVIRMIAKDNTLTDRQRSQLMQNLMLQPYLQSKISSNWHKRAKLPPCSEDSTNSLSDVYEENYLGEMSPTFREMQDGSRLLGCSHYLRGAKIRTVCCQKFYTCRLCHDKHEDHKVGDNRYATKEMLCMYCGTIQPIAQWCSNPSCSKRMARYFCPICKLFDDDPHRNIYHCHSCNVCRVGKGLGIDSFHCMKCNACMNMKYAKSHRCIEHSMETDCPICYQYLFTSTSPVKYLQCGHLMHVACYNSYSKTSYICPICQHSMQDMSSYFEQLDRQLANDRSTRLYHGIQSHVQCNDCHRESDVRFHFIFHKCAHCGSYNTRVLQVHRRLSR
eukprot:jgi/Galph1/2188/GphlegSOOS_G849.1